MTNLIAALNPVALSFGGLEIRWYGVIIAAGILVAMTLATKEAEKKGLDPDFHRRHDVLDDTDRNHRRPHLLCIV